MIWIDPSSTKAFALEGNADWVAQTARRRISMVTLTAADVRAWIILPRPFYGTS